MKLTRFTKALALLLILLLTLTACDLGSMIPSLTTDTTAAETTQKPQTSFIPPDGVEAPAHTVAGSVNCADSVGNFMKAAGIDSMGDPVRVARCACVTADVAAKTVELLNIHFGFTAAAAEEAESSDADPPDAAGGHRGVRPDSLYL